MSWNDRVRVSWNVAVVHTVPGTCQEAYQGYGGACNWVKDRVASGLRIGSHRDQGQGWRGLRELQVYEVHSATWSALDT